MPTVKLVPPPNRPRTIRLAWLWIYCICTNFRQEKICLRALLAKKIFSMNIFSASIGPPTISWRIVRMLGEMKFLSQYKVRDIGEIFSQRKFLHIRYSFRPSSPVLVYYGEFNFKFAGLMTRVWRRNGHLMHTSLELSPWRQIQLDNVGSQCSGVNVSTLNM